MDVIAVPTLEDVSPDAWNALVGDNNPFVEYAFLRLLETSKSVGASEGWLPFYLLIKDGDDLVGATMAYLKGHSYGEFIFDWSWADAAMRAGVDYYPKLVVMTPFTPATGPRLLVRPDVERERVWGALVDGLDALMRELDASSVHVLHCHDDEAAFMSERGFARRATYQFHFRNPGYEDFDDFLSNFRSSTRKQVRRERRRVQESDLEVEVRYGDTLSVDEWMHIDALYRSTSARKWGSPYLKRAFFEHAKDTVGNRAVVALAKRNDTVVAMTLSFEKGSHLYGRYWGAFGYEDNLHFELCYYRLVEHAIDKGMVLVEAGAQGEHKIKRGFLPVTIHSCHKFALPGLGKAVKKHLDDERAHIEREVAEWYTQGPFKEGGEPAFPAISGIDLVAARAALAKDDD